MEGAQGFSGGDGAKCKRCVFKFAYIWQAREGAVECVFVFKSMCTRQWVGLVGIYLNRYTYGHILPTYVCFGFFL